MLCMLGLLHGPARFNVCNLTFLFHFKNAQQLIQEFPWAQGAAAAAAEHAGGMGGAAAAAGAAGAAAAAAAGAAGAAAAAAAGAAAPPVAEEEADEDDPMSEGSSHQQEVEAAAAAGGAAGGGGGGWWGGAAADLAAPQAPGDDVMGEPPQQDINAGAAAAPAEGAAAAAAPELPEGAAEFQALTEALAAGTVQQVAPRLLADAPAERVYADVLRGLHGLRKLDVDVTGLCKVMKLSSSPLANVCELRLYMLGSVLLPPGGLPQLPSLTHLEFYLPGERNWGECHGSFLCPLTRRRTHARHQLPWLGLVGLLLHVGQLCVACSARHLAIAVS